MQQALETLRGVDIMLLCDKFFIGGALKID
jgi:hypothetical protein